MTRCLENISDEMKKSIGVMVLVKLRNGCEIRGKLKGFDLHLNLVLEDAEEISERGKISLGYVIIRGDAILFISPMKTGT